MRYAPLQDLETPRLILRRFRPSDLEAHYRHITSDPEVAKTMLWEADPARTHAETVLNRILSRYGSREGYRWAIARKETDELIGTISLLRLEEADNSCSFAYMLGKAFWGQGHGTEAVRAVLSFAFSQLEVRTVTADHFSSNPASGAVMKKAGMRYLGTLPGKYEKNGVKQDAVCYAITREDWSKPGH